MELLYSYTIWRNREVVTSTFLFLVLQQTKNAWLFTVQETENSSAWNHISKNQRRDPPRRRARKVLSLWHTHGTAPRRSYQVRQFLARWKRTALDQNNKTSWGKKKAADVLPLSLLSGLFFACLWAVQHRCLIAVHVVNAPCPAAAGDSG